MPTFAPVLKPDEPVFALAGSVSVVVIGILAVKVMDCMEVRVTPDVTYVTVDSCVAIEVEVKVVGSAEEAEGVDCVCDGSSSVEESSVAVVGSGGMEEVGEVVGEVSELVLVEVEDAEDVLEVVLVVDGSDALVDGEGAKVDDEVEELEGLEEVDLEEEGVEVGADELDLVGGTENVEPPPPEVGVGAALLKGTLVVLLPPSPPPPPPVEVMGARDGARDVAPPVVLLMLVCYRGYMD